MRSLLFLSCGIGLVFGMGMVAGALPVKPPVKAWTYDELMADADFVVIATPVSVKKLPNLAAGGVPGFQKVQTTFKTETILKGLLHLAASKSQTQGKTGPVKVKSLDAKFVVEHHQYVDPHTAVTTIDGPSYVSFDGPPRVYLLFLKRSNDKINFEPVSAESDPTASVRILTSYTHPPAVIRP